MQWRKIKQGRRWCHGGCWAWVTLLQRVVRGLAGKVAFEQKPESSRRVNYGDTWGENISGRKKTSCKRPCLGPCSLYSGNMNGSAAEVEQTGEKEEMWVWEAGLPRIAADVVYSGRDADTRQGCAFEEYWAF